MPKNIQLKKKILSTKQKPIEIVNLEKFYNITLANKKFEANYYTLNSSGEVDEISINQLSTEDLTPIREIKSLRTINLTRNSIEDISTLLPHPNLQQIFLGGNKIQDISPISGAANLIMLIIWGNPVKDFTPISQLKKLQALYCQETGLKDLTFIKELKNLSILNAGRNNIEDISIIKYLKSLKRVDLDNNLIRVVPKDIAEEFRWLKQEPNSRTLRSESDNKLKYFNLSNNPLQFPPLPVIELGEENTRNYYEAIDTYGGEALSEGRIIVVGDGSAGKSSLIERILHGTFQEGKTQTNGIRIENWKLQHVSNKRSLIFHLWDFGGQEIQHSVHKFFFTEGCLYVLVLDNRKEEDPEYWLQQIESLGGSAPVTVVFNKQDDNTAEVADRKFLKEKYPNIVGFYNTSCKTGVGIKKLKKDLEKEVVQLRTVDEQFPNNWFKIKREIENCTRGQHYINYSKYEEICKLNHVENEKVQKLLLNYFTTIGSITWFGDTYLNFLHVLSPAWITQGVYKIITSKYTATKAGKIVIHDFPDLLAPVEENDYIYEEQHYGYILSMMKKFDLCYTPDDINLLIPSAFHKIPKIEYKDFKGETVRTYILQFRDYMPLAIIHRFTAKQLQNAYDNNYWYSGIVLKDNKSSSLAMVQADKEAKRIYIRIKGEAQLGMWEYIRRELSEIAASYAKIPYEELIALDENAESTVSYSDLISYLKASKPIYFHPKLQKDFNVGFLIGLFESKEITIEKFANSDTVLPELRVKKTRRSKPPSSVIINILNNSSPTVTANVTTDININIQLVSKFSSEIKAEANYLLDTINPELNGLIDALKKVIQFADDAKKSQNSTEIKEKGWGRKLKNVLEVIGNSAKQIKNIKDGGASLKAMIQGISNLAAQLDMHELLTFLHNLFK